MRPHCACVHQPLCLGKIHKIYKSSFTFQIACAKPFPPPYVYYSKFKQEIKTKGKEIKNKQQQKLKIKAGRNHIADLSTNQQECVSFTTRRESLRIYGVSQ